MPHNEFIFKQFRVCQDREVMKVGTDGVLLGSWVDPIDAEYILDIGTGTGLLALMMAQKCEATIHAIDIDPEAYKQAQENFINSIWRDRLWAFHMSLQHYILTCTFRYDLIISNPPFFLHAHKAESESRNVARHLDQSLNIADIADGVKHLLKPDGRFCVIFPFREGIKFIEYAETHGLYMNKITRVKTKALSQDKRVMLELSPVRKKLVEDELIIQDIEKKYTNQYKSLTSEFYLNK